jgi:hypothetical protein
MESSFCHVGAPAGNLKGARDRESHRLRLSHALHSRRRDRWGAWRIFPGKCGRKRFSGGKVSGTSGCRSAKQTQQVRAVEKTTFSLQRAQLALTFAYVIELIRVCQNSRAHHAVLSVPKVSDPATKAPNLGGFAGSGSAKCGLCR